MANDMDHYSKIYMNKKASEAKRTGKDDKNFQHFWKNYNIELNDQEQDEKRGYRKRCKDLQNYHRMQARERTKRMESELLEEMKEARVMKLAQEKEENTFNSWAEQSLKQWGSEGKNITPMLLELQAQRNASSKLQFFS